MRGDAGAPPQTSAVALRRGLPDGPGFNPWYAWAYVYSPREYYTALRRRYGDVATVPATEAKLVMALTAAGARELLTADPDGYEAFQKGAFTGLIGPGSLWVLDGARHRLERRVLAPGFHAQRVHAFAQAIHDFTRLHTNRWQPGQQLRIYDEMMDVTRDVILYVVLGLEDGADLDEGRRTLKQLVDTADPWVTHFTGLQRGWFPSWRRVTRAKREIAALLTRLMTERRARSDEAKDALGMLMAARFDDGAAIPDREVHDEIVTILVSGHETTAVGLSWALYELARHPAILARLRDEIDALGAKPDPSQIVKLPYLGAVCDETLRRDTVLTDVARIARVPLEMFGYEIPAGVGVGIGIGGIHQDPELYPEPDVFRPERFLERTFGPYEFLPFGGGNRRCLGAVLAEYQLRISLAAVVRDWDLEAVGTDFDVRHSIGTYPKHGIRMRVTGRHNLS